MNMLIASVESDRRKNKQPTSENCTLGSADTAEERAKPRYTMLAMVKQYSSTGTMNAACRCLARIENITMASALSES